MKKFAIICFVPILLLIWVLKPLIKIRWCRKYFSDRIGHLVSEMEHYLIFQKVFKKKNTFDLFPKSLFTNKNPSNKFLSNHYKDKVLTVHDNLIKLLQKTQSLIEINFRYFKFDNFDEELSTRDKYQIFGKKYKPSIKFLESHMKEIHKFKKKIDLKDGEKFICLIVRDSKYLKERFPNQNWNYHNYRDSDINTFIPGINFLTKTGFKVIRMGKNQKKSFKIYNKNYFDYSCSKFQSDLIDVWLLSMCTLCISTGTGLDQIARIFNKPILFINHLPLADWSSHIKSLTHPKYMIFKKTNKMLNLNEYIKYSSLKFSDYNKCNIKIVNLSKREILTCFREFVLLYKKNWKILKKNMKIQNDFKKTFKKGIKKYKTHIDFHKHINKHALISENFLKKSKHQNL